MRAPLSRSKRITFTLLTAVFVLLAVELGARIIEVVVRQVQLGGTSSRFVSYQNVREVFAIENIAGINYNVRTPHHPYILSGIRFRAEKSANTFRVFCLGGSAALGWPHPPDLSYPTFLSKKLQLLYPEKTIEVINAAASTYASYRVKVVFDEIIRYEPDLILLYSGNNEFLEKVLYQQPSPLAAPWKHLAITRTIHQAWAQFESKKQIIDVENYRPTFLIDVALGNASTLKVSQDQYQQVVEHYRYNLTKMVGSAQQRSVPIMLLTVPANVRHWHPHASVHQAGLDSASKQQWQEWYGKGIQAFQQENYPTAVEYFSKALQLDDQYAELHYYLGKTYEQLGKVSKTQTHLIRSLEADAYPFRALPEFNSILRTISQDYEVPLVDIEREFSQRSPWKITGEEALVDHVHPTAASNQLIADAVLREILQTEILPPKDSLDFARVQLPVSQQAEASLPLMQHLFLIYRVLLQFDKMDSLYQRCLELPDFEKQTSRYTAFMTEFDRFLAVMRPYQALLLAEKTGRLSQEFTSQEVTTIVQNYVDLSRNSLTENMSEEEFQTFVPTSLK